MLKKVIASLIILMVAAGASIWFMVTPVLSGATPTKSWWIVTNTEDDYNKFAAELLRDEYGAEIVDWSQRRNWNKLGQNLLLIGGSDYLSEEAPWFRPGMEIAKPSTQPNVYFNKEDDTWYLYTPYSTYECNSENDYGVITIAYDPWKFRWIVIIAGYSGHCTIAGAILFTHSNIAAAGYSYIVYKLTSHPTQEPWDTNEYDWAIVEMG